MTKSIQTVGVCGAGGTMGAGTRVVAARAGFKTISFDASKRRSTGRQTVGGTFSTSPSRGKARQAASADAIVANDVAHHRDRRAQGLRPGDRGGCSRNLSVKRDSAGRLDAVCAKDAIFASNTSTLSITEIAAGSKHTRARGRMHFCLPAQLMK